MACVSSQPVEHVVADGSRLEASLSPERRLDVTAILSETTCLLVRECMHNTPIPVLAKGMSVKKRVWTYVQATACKWAQTLGQCLPSHFLRRLADFGRPSGPASTKRIPMA